MANHAHLQGSGSIRLTFIANYLREGPTVYDTTSLHDALMQDVDGHFSSEGPERWVFCTVVEREGNPFTRAEIVEQLEEILRIERYRASRQAGS